jgi:hypothetical protein
MRSGALSHLLQLEADLLRSNHDQLVKRLCVNRLSSPLVIIEELRKLEGCHRTIVITVIARFLDNIQDQLVFVGARLTFKEPGFNQLIARQQPGIIAATQPRAILFVVLNIRIAIVAKGQDQKRRAC